MIAATRQRVAYFGLALVTVPIGLAIRFVPLGLPWFVMKYGGSTLWAVMIYWVLAFLWPRGAPRSLALAAGTIATLVELLRLYHSAALDAFRISLPGIILLGRFFSVLGYCGVLDGNRGGCAGGCLGGSSHRIGAMSGPLLESSHSDEVSLLWFCPGPSCRFTRE